MKLQELQGDWSSLSALLDQALEVEPAERGAWLASLAGDEANYRDTLARLLAAPPGIETHEYLEELPRFGVPGGQAGDALGAPAADDSVGPYRLISELGHGGMATVWLAERADAQPRRKVALKLPHLGWAPGLSERLARERDILASLEHPHIARLYDAGVDQLGRPYLALEYVAGTPIDVYCRTHDLALERRLALVLQVAGAVAHAHTRLVVHRDLKPSNILVTDDGAVRLLDFGIAKLLQVDGAEATELTRLSGRALTIDYASPEQIRGETIGTASDVYSLGVVVYELLAGSRPFRLNANGIGGLTAAIAHAVAPPASRTCRDPATRRQLIGDLDAILNKALKKDPAERYVTVAAFADDIERHLRHEPVTARPDRLAYRMGKFVVRHALPVTAAGVVLAAVLGGAGVALWQARAARVETAHADQVKGFLLSIFEDANAGSGSGVATTAVDLLTAAQTRIDKEFAGRPDVATELLAAVGYSLIGQGKDVLAADVFHRAVDLGTRQLGAQHPRTVAAVIGYAEALNSSGHSTDAIAILGPAIDASRRGHRTHDLVQGMRILSQAKLYTGDLDGAVAAGQAGVDAMPVPTDRAAKIEAMNMWGSLAEALGNAKRPGEVEAARHALALSIEVYGTGLSNASLSFRVLLASALGKQDQATEALQQFESVLADTRQFLGPTHPQTGWVLNKYGNVRLEAGDTAGAIASFLNALSISEGTPGKGPTALGIDQYAVGRAFLAAHRFDDALPHLDASAKLLREAGGADSPQALRSLDNGALALARLGKLDAAEQRFAGLEHAHWAGADQAAHGGRLAVLRSLQGRHDEAIALARESAEFLRNFPSKTARAYSNLVLGQSLIAGGLTREALGPLEESVRLYTERQVVMSPDHADALRALTQARAAQQRTVPNPTPDSARPASRHSRERGVLVARLR